MLNGRQLSKIKSSVNLHLACYVGVRQLHLPGTPHRLNGVFLVVTTIKNSLSYSVFLFVIGNLVLCFVTNITRFRRGVT